MKIFFLFNFQYFFQFQANAKIINVSITQNYAIMRETVLIKVTKIQLIPVCVL